MANIHGTSGPETLTGTSVNDNIWGDDGDDHLIGLGGRDVLAGEEGDDTLDGGDGNDSLRGGAGADTLIGGAGIDTASYSDATAGVSVKLDLGIGLTGDASGDTFSGVENLRGSAYRDIFYGDAGRNEMSGLEGNDSLYGRDGNDLLRGDDGDDFLHGGRGFDEIWGGAGRDTIAFTVDSDHDSIRDFDAGAGGDYIRLPMSIFADFDEVMAHAIEGDGGGDFGTITTISKDGLSITLPNVLLSHLVAENFIFYDDGAYVGTSGADFYVGGDGTNGAFGREGDDTLSGLNGDDRLHGQEGEDLLIGGAGADRLFGDEGDDVLTGGAGADHLDGGTGIDTADYSDATAGVTARLAGAGATPTGDAAGDVYVSIENLTGSDFDDVLIGSNNAANVLDGGDGNDILEGLTGADVLIGGAGLDHASYGASASRVTVKLDEQLSSAGAAAGDTYDGIEGVIGSRFSDALYGDAGANSLLGMDGSDSLYGRDGDDTLVGGAGNDKLTGGRGSDELTGGTGADTFVFTAASGSDTITDFETDVPGEVIQLPASLFADFAEVMSHASDTVDGVVISKGALTLTLTGLTTGDLSADDFGFPAAAPASAPVRSDKWAAAELTLPPHDAGEPGSDWLL